MAEHFVTIEIDHDGARPRFTCTAQAQDGAATSPCRWYCNTCEEECYCETVGEDRYSTFTRELGYCRFIEGWFDDEPWELYEGDPTTARTAPVAFTWDGDTYWWHYADQPPQRTPKPPDSGVSS